MFSSCVWLLALALVVVAPVCGQIGGGKFTLPNLNRPLHKATVAEDLSKYFQLTGSARQFVDNFLGRPGNNQIIPDPMFEVAGSNRQTPPDFIRLPQIPGINGPLNLPPGFNNGFSLISNNKNAGAGGAAPLSAASLNDKPQTVNVDASQGASEKDGDPLAVAGSSIKGIPNFYPKLPPAPIPQQNVAPRIPQASANLAIPSIPTRPEIPDGGLGLLASLTGGTDEQATSSLLNILNQQQLLQQQPATSPFGTQFNPSQILAGLQQNPSILTQPGGGASGDAAGGLLGPFLEMLGLKQYAGQFGQLLSGRVPTSPAAGGAGGNQQGVLGAVIYNALTNNAIQKQGNGTDGDGGNATAPAQFSQDQAALLGSNIALIQQLLTQPDSPFCTAKPVPVQWFNVDAFMGTWYQTLYSPPLAAGPCSMVAYKKLADVSQGGVGTVFDTFEYTTEGTPFGRPTISSGYAIVRAPGELIYRTTSSPSDINVHVIDTGPINENGEYEYAILSVNCNYPLHVYARDPIQYKRKYEGQVNAFLEQRGITNGFSRLLNIVAPVDSTLCNFPPTLFNIRG